MAGEEGKMNFCINPLKSTEVEEVEELAKDFWGSDEGGYRRLSKQNVPNFIAEGLREKLYAAMLMGQKTSDGTLCLVVNCIRLDLNDNAIDQNPFGIILYTSGASTQGVYIQHGNWHERSIVLTPELKRIITSTSMGDYYPLNNEPPNSSVPLFELGPTAHEGAFNTVLNYLVTGASA